MSATCFSTNGAFSFWKKRLKSPLQGNSSKSQMQLRLDLRKVLLQKLWMVETRRALWSYPHCGWNQSQLWINPNFCWNRDFYPGKPWPGKKCLGVQGTMSRHLRPCHARDVSRLQLDPLVVLLLGMGQSYKILEPGNSRFWWYVTLHFIQCCAYIHVYPHCSWFDMV